MQDYEEQHKDIIYNLNVNICGRILKLSNLVNDRAFLQGRL